MQKKMLYPLIVGFLLLTSPARAQIKAALETPFDGQDVSGKAVVSGWAFSTLDPNAQVNVRLLANGVDAGVVVPCCGPRADVQAQNPGAPLNSSFGILLNYGLFDPTILTSVGVQITAPNETPVTINNAVKLAKPGARSTDPTPALFSFLDELNISGVRTAPDETDILVTPVEVTDQDAGGTRQATLRLRWATNAQAFGIVAAASGTSFDDNIQPIFTTRCATALCHDNVTREAGLDLSAGKGSRRTIAVRSSLDTEERFRVNPGKAIDSYLYQKIIPGGAITQGTIMPPACANTPSSCLSGGEIQAITNWINEGAPPTQQ